MIPTLNIKQYWPFQNVKFRLLPYIISSFHLAQRLAHWRGSAPAEPRPCAASCCALCSMSLLLLATIM